MDHSLFRNSKAGASLIMQVSSPVVVPAEMGFGFMEILQRLATYGIEKLSMHVNKVMPLDDITGITMEEVLWETSPAINSGQSLILQLIQESLVQALATITLAQSMYHLKILLLSLEGLRIQSGMSEEDAPSDITAQSIGEILTFQGLEGAAGLQLMNIKEDGDGDSDGLMGLSLTLDEWMKLRDCLFLQSL